MKEDFERQSNVHILTIHYEKLESFKTLNLN